MTEEWYSRDYLGREFDRFLSSEMNSTDFQRLSLELVRVLEQLQLSRAFIASGYQNKIGKIHTKPKEVRETSSSTRIIPLRSNR